MSVPVSFQPPAIDKKGKVKNSIVINLIVNLLRITLFNGHLKIDAKLCIKIKTKNNF